MQTKSATTATKAANISVIPKTPFRFLLYMAKPHKWWFIGTVGVVILASALSQSTNYLFKLIVDSVEAGRSDMVLYYALAFPVAVWLTQLLFRLSGFLGMHSVTRVMKSGTDEMMEYTLKHSHGYFIDRFAGSIMNKYTNVIGALGQMWPGIFWNHIPSVVSLLVTFIFMLTVDVVTAFIFLALIFVLIKFNRMLAPRKRELSKSVASVRTKINGRTVDVFTNMIAVRQYARTNEEYGLITDLTEERRVKRNKSWVYTERMLLANGFILFIFTMAMFWSLTSGWQSGEVTSGDLVLILSLVSSIAYTLIFIGRAIDETAKAFGEMEEGLEDLLVEHEIIDAEDAAELVPDGGAVSWKEVTFTFGDNVVFDSFDLAIGAGQRVGLVGPSGAGKTTFVSLLLRQHDIDAGSITIDGQDISEVTQDSLRRAISVVPQEPALFHRSIRENILYGNPEASEEEVIAVAKKAQAHDFIMELPDGYETLVGERGIKLSGGQKQRVAIARAMLKNAPVLILDEATSALDSESEVAIQKALHELMEGKTVIAIAHRLSTLREMDRVLVLEEGAVVEDGSHDELSESGGTYQRLWEHQAGGFLQE